MTAEFKILTDSTARDIDVLTQLISNTWRFWFFVNCDDFIRWYIRQINIYNKNSNFNRFLISIVFMFYIFLFLISIVSLSSESYAESCISIRNHWNLSTALTECFLTIRVYEETAGLYAAAAGLIRTQNEITHAASTITLN